MAYDEALARRLRAVMPAGPGITEKRMFGGLAFLACGHMFVGIVGDTLMARVGPAAHAAALGQPHVREMDFTGKPLRGYVCVDAPGLAASRELKRWVMVCLQFVQSLPPKAPKQPKPPKQPQQPKRKVTRIGPPRPAGDRIHGSERALRTFDLE
jgi:TfoX/Sxy family transcriptional regulator of competence genes